MSAAQQANGLSDASLRQLRHDLLNPLNVLIGASAALQQTELTAVQKQWVTMLQSTTNRLLNIVEHIDTYQQAPMLEGRERLADLCSIAAARVGKPFDRERLVSAIDRVAGGRRPLRILVVDDSPELSLLVRTFLRDLPWELDFVDNGERAVDQANAEQYDVVLMDIDLPGLDGATAAHAIRSADLARGASPTPIIAMTAFDPPPPHADTFAEFGESAETAAAVDEPDPDIVTIDDPEIAPLVPEFLENRRADVVQWRAALARGQYGGIQSAAHKLKGTGRGYGFTALSRIGGALEHAAHHQDRDQIGSLIDELDAYLSRVKVIG
ncbi:MAG TPA: response regulator [Vicinamibacterales bacterium]|nr:response regulator [Vicinamibacterales bacterium]